MRAPALLLHGGPGLSDYLDDLADELEPVFELERYEQGRHFDVPTFVDEALGHLGRPQWLVGHSWGGLLAFHTAAAAPESVLGVVAIGSLGVVGMGGWDRVEEPMLARLTDEERERLATAPPGAGFEISWPAYFSSRDATPPFPGIRSDPEVLQAVYGWLEQHTAEPGIVDALRRLDRPVLILHGSEDVIPLEPLEETAALIPAAKLTVFQGVGHFPWVERPGCVHAAVVDFLAARSS